MRSGRGESFLRKSLPLARVLATTSQTSMPVPAMVARLPAGPEVKTIPGYRRIRIALSRSSLVVREKSRSAASASSWMDWTVLTGNLRLDAHKDYPAWPGWAYSGTTMTNAGGNFMSDAKVVRLAGTDIVKFGPDAF